MFGRKVKFSMIKYSRPAVFALRQHVLSSIMYSSEIRTLLCSVK